MKLWAGSTGGLIERRGQIFCDNILRNSELSAIVVPIHRIRPAMRAEAREENRGSVTETFCGLSETGPDFLFGISVNY